MGREEGQQQHDNQQTQWANAAEKNHASFLSFLFSGLLNCITMSPIHETIEFYYIQVWERSCNKAPITTISQLDELKVKFGVLTLTDLALNAAIQEQAHNTPATSAVY